MAAHVCVQWVETESRENHVNAVDAQRAAVFEADASQADPDDGRHHHPAADACRQPHHSRRGTGHTRVLVTRGQSDLTKGRIVAAKPNRK